MREIMKEMNPHSDLFLFSCSRVCCVQASDNNVPILHAGQLNCTIAERFCADARTVSQSLNVEFAS